MTPVLPTAQRTLPALLRLQAERFGERPLFRAGATQWSFAGATDVAARRAATLLDAGVRAGDRVALLIGNHAAQMELLLACGWIGAIAVPINTASMGPQIGYALANSGATLLAIDAEFVPRLAQVDATAAGFALRRVWVHGGDADAGALGVPCEPLPPHADAAEPAPVRPGDTLSILYTSGTTGPSKGVMCPQAQYVAWGLNTARLLEIGPDDVLCTNLPLFHVNALNTFAQALVTGARMVLLPRFSASGYWPSMGEHGATVIYLLGAMVPMLLAQAPSAAERAHRVRSGLGPGVPAAMNAAFRERCGVLLLEGYGSTETNFALGAAAAGQKPGTMGVVQPGFHARVVDADDAELPDGEAGELVLRADEPFAFATGYFGMAEQTVAAWRNLWFHTGDRVVRDADGHFRFVDRLKDAIRRRGENISSYEVEQVLLSHPAVATAAVYPVRSELAEDEVMAALVPKDGMTIDPLELLRFCEPRLPHFALPRFVETMAELPRTESGKVQKFRLRERGRGAATWDREAAGWRRAGR